VIADNTEIFGAVTLSNGDLLGILLIKMICLIRGMGNGEQVDWTLLALSTLSLVNLAG
jgi:hypothetical protein